MDAAGMLEAERRFRKIIGHADLAKLAIAVERELAANAPPITVTTPSRPAAPEVAASPFAHRIAAVEFHGERDILGKAIDDG